MSFVENLSSLRREFADRNALNNSIGRDATLEDVFSSLENLANGRFNTVGEMLENSPFNAQNEAYRGVATMLNDMGTPVKSLTKRNSGGARKMSGNSFVEEMLKEKGLSLPTREKKSDS